MDNVFRLVYMCTILWTLKRNTEKVYTGFYKAGTNTPWTYFWFCVNVFGTFHIPVDLNKTHMMWHAVSKSMLNGWAAMVGWINRCWLFLVMLAAAPCLANSFSLEKTATVKWKLTEQEGERRADGKSCSKRIMFLSGWLARPQHVFNCV